MKNSFIRLLLRDIKNYIRTNRFFLIAEAALFLIGCMIADMQKPDSYGKYTTIQYYMQIFRGCYPFTDARTEVFQVPLTWFTLMYFCIYTALLYPIRDASGAGMLSNQWLNILIVGIYFVFLIVIGWIFRTFSSNTSDYFKGGGKMLWWMVGSTAFMTQFSAWSFTGAAGKAFSNGLSVMMIFLGNALGYFFNYLFFAAKSRQVRVVTPIEGIRLRFGKVNEQVFT